jgi:uncharacterized protein
MNEIKLFFQSQQNKKLCGILRSPGGANAPVIILVHGFTSDKNTGSFKGIIQGLDEANIASFRIDLFGSGESEGNFAELTTSEAVSNVLSAIQFMKDMGFAKIGLLGSSFGGLCSLMAASKSKDLFCLALKSPVANWAEVPLWKPKLQKWKEKGYVTYDEGYEPKRLNYSFYEDFKNNNGYEVALKITIPTLIVHGDTDETVPYEQATKLESLLPNGNLHTIKGADHRYTRPEHFAEMTKVFVKFLVEQAE